MADKFKVGDRVMMTGTVATAHTNPSLYHYEIAIDGQGKVSMAEYELQPAEQPTPAWVILNQAADIFVENGFPPPPEIRLLAGDLEEKANTPSLEDAARAILEAWRTPGLASGDVAKQLRNLRRALDGLQKSGKTDEQS